MNKHRHHVASPHYTSSHSHHTLSLRHAELDSASTPHQARNNRTKGFTLIELVIVIVVVAILVTISVVAYSGVQTRARDARRISDIAQIKKAMMIWSAQNSKGLSQIGAGYSGTAIGYYHAAYAPYPSVQSLLIGSQLISQNVIDPIGGSGSYMMAPCSDSSPDEIVIMAKLENAPSQTIIQQIGKSSCPNTFMTDYITTFGMNYGVIAS